MKKNIFIFILLLSGVPGVMYAAGPVITQPPPTSSSGITQPQPQNQTTIKPVIRNPLREGVSKGGIPGIIEAVMRGVVMPLASVLVVLALLYSGFKFVIAQGNSTEIQKARDGLLWVLIGSAILLGAYGISEFVRRTITQVVEVEYNI